jgi:hypothetical protein
MHSVEAEGSLLRSQGSSLDPILSQQNATHTTEKASINNSKSVMLLSWYMIDKHGSRSVQWMDFVPKRQTLNLCNRI